MSTERVITKLLQDGRITIHAPPFYDRLDRLGHLVKTLRRDDLVLYLDQALDLPALADSGAEGGTER